MIVRLGVLSYEGIVHMNSEPSFAFLHRVFDCFHYWGL